MTDKELIARLRDAVNGEHDMTPHGADVLQAADRIEQLVATNEALTEQLAAARQDANEAEAYAGELEMELRDTQDRANAFATKEYYTEMRAERAEAKLSTCEKYRDAYDEMGRIGTQAVRELEAKLAKAVEVLEQCEIMLRLRGHDEVADNALTTLAEIKGGKHD